MAETADNLRDKALILVLYDSGCRIGEILTLQLKHVQFDKYGAVLVVDGKTGQRRVRLIMSAPKLHQWIENHPLRNDNEAPLWVTIGTNSRGTPIKYPSALDHIRNIARKTGIKKRVYPHLFRHSRATHLANALTEAQMKQYFGWTQASDMASTYVHMSGRDVDGAFMKANGMDVPNDGKPVLMQAVCCPRCKVQNSPDAKFCSGCGMCIDAKAAMEVEETKAKADALITELVKKPEVLDKMLRLLGKTN